MLFFNRNAYLHVSSEVLWPDFGLQNIIKHFVCEEKEESSCKTARTIGKPFLVSCTCNTCMSTQILSVGSYIYSMRVIDIFHSKQ